MAPPPRTIFRTPSGASERDTELSAQETVDPALIRRVMLSQMLFSAGNALTTGGFFNYFVYEFHPSAFLLSALLIAPEASQSFSVFGRSLALVAGSRKWVWIYCLIVARVAACLVPAALICPPGLPPLLLILAGTVIWYLAQGMAYVNYISWLSDLAPSKAWGKLFGSRQLASLGIATCVPLATVALRSSLLRGLPESAAHLSYACLFLAGGLLCMLSILPLLTVADIPLRIPPSAAFDRRWILRPAGRPFRFLLASRWWLAFFQGLTQAVLFKYAKDQLNLSLEAYTALVSLMLLLQLPMTWCGARISDADRDRSGLIWSLLAVSGALPCWMLASRQFWQPVCLAYGLWGGFGLVNICFNNLCLKLAPRSDNAAQFATFEQIGGLIAAVAGLLGGDWLDRLLNAATSDSTAVRSAYLTLLITSWLGRLTAPLWLLGVRQSAIAPAESHPARPK